MTAPISADELHEIENLAAEADSPARRKALMAELIRLRTLAQECRRHAGRLPRKVQQTLDAKVPRRANAAEWAQAVAEGLIEDTSLPGSPRLI